MGIFGLMSYCLNNREQCVEYVDLVEVAASRKEGIEILCDFYCVEHLLISSLWKSLWLVSGNCYLELLGGEYASLGDYISKLVDDLRSLNIKLVMFVDGAKGTSADGFERKFHTWKSRHFRDLRRIRDRLAVLHRECKIEEPIKDDFRPVLLEVQMIETFKQCGCEMVQCTSIEADYVIARNLLNRPNAFAILSNDSDFCVFNNCRFIPFDLFDLNGELKLGQKQRLPSKPVKLCVGLIHSAKVWSTLGFDSQDEMIQLSILQGNDFTASYSKLLKEKLGLGNQLLDLVEWIKSHGALEQNEPFAAEMQKDKHLKETVDHAKQFYRLMLSNDHAEQHDYVTNFISDRVEKNQFPSNILAMHFGIYWHRMMIEDEGRNCRTAEVALAPLRSYIYRMILHQGRKKVKEYGRVFIDRDFGYRDVCTSEATFVPSIVSVPKDKILPNLTTFHQIMTHQELRFPVIWHKRYGWRDGFKCSILRYFLVMNFRQNLNLTLDEFLPLVALVFCQVDVEFYQGLCILPESRCVTIGNWFQDVYRHAFHFLAKLLNVSEQFPNPSSIFSGAVWTAFYMVSLKSNLSFIDLDNIQRIEKDLNNMIQEKRHIIRNLVDQFFDDRF